MWWTPKCPLSLLRDLMLERAEGCTISPMDVQVGQPNSSHEKTTIISPQNPQALSCKWPSCGPTDPSHRNISEFPVCWLQPNHSEVNVLATFSTMLRNYIYTLKNNDLERLQLRYLKVEAWCMISLHGGRRGVYVYLSPTCSLSLESPQGMLGLNQQ